MRRRLTKRVIRAIGVAVLIACFLALWTLLIYAVGGRESFDAYGTSLGRVIVTYFALAIMAGSLVGLLQPLAGSPQGAALIGCLVAIPAFIALQLAQGRYGEWSMTDIATMLVWSLFLGAPAGIVYRSIFSKKGDT